MSLLKQIPIYFISIIVIYLFAFNPIYLPFTGVGLIKMLYPFLLLYVFGGAEYRKNFRLLWPITILYFTALLYSSFLSLLHDTDILYTRLVNFIEVYLMPISIATLFVKQNIKLPTVVFAVAAIASIITFIAFINPDFLSLLRNVQPIFEKANEWTLVMREYGFSSELYSGYGWGLGFVVVYYLRYFKEYRYYIVLLPVIAFAILVNARSGFVAVMIGIVIYTVFARKLSSIFTNGIIVIGFIYLISYLDLSWINEGSMKFITDFFEQMSSLLTGKGDETYMDTYMGRQFVLPENLFQWIFGRGFSLMGNTFGIRSSDVGYLNDLAVGGLIYVGLVYTSFYRMIKLIHVRWFFVATLAVVAAINVKGQCMETSSLSRMVALVCFYEFIKAEKKDKSLIYEKE